MSRCSLLEKLYFQKFGTKRLLPLVGWWIPGVVKKLWKDFEAAKSFVKREKGWEVHNSKRPSYPI